MSYQYKQPDVHVVVCDICDDFSWVGDPQWRPMKQSTMANPIHLCAACRRTAVWCAAHQQYHLPDTLHRHACADCGGLFTSVVRDNITRCPSCRRAAGDYPAPPVVQPREPARSLLQKLFSLSVGERR